MIDYTQIDDPQVAQAIVADIESNQNIKRRQDEWKLYETYNGNQKEYVENKLKSLMPNEYKSMRISDVSITRKVVNKLAKAYKEGVIRTLTDDVKTEELQAMYEDFDFDRSFVEFDQIINRHKYGALYLLQKGEEKEFTLLALSPYEFTVLRDQDTGRAKTFILNYPDEEITGNSGGGDALSQAIADSQSDSSANKRVYAMWTNDKFVVWRVRDSKVNINGSQATKLTVDYVPIENNPGNVNRLGMLPFVFLSKDMAVDLPALNNLGEQSIDFNILFSDVLSAASKQGFGQLVLSHPAGMQIDKLHGGMSTAITLPQPPEGEGSVTAEFINPNPDLAGQLDVYSRYIEMILSDHGITSASGLTGNGAERFSSGLDRLLAQADVQGIIESNQQMYTKVEKKVFEILVAYLALNGDSTFINEDFNVNFQRPKVLISDTELINNLEKLMSLGLITKKKALQKLDPNIGDSEAEKQLEEIEQEKLDRVQTFMGGMIDNKEDQARPEQSASFGQDDGQE